MIIANQVIDGSNYATGYTGKYFYHCDTYNEVRDALHFICISRPKKMSEISPEDVAAKDKFFVLVRFSKEEDYTQHDLYWMTVQKKYVKSFIKRLKDDGIRFSEEVPV